MHTHFINYHTIAEYNSSVSLLMVFTMGQSWVWFWKRIIHIWEHNIIRKMYADFVNMDSLVTFTEKLQLYKVD